MVDRECFVVAGRGSDFDVAEEFEVVGNLGNLVPAADQESLGGQRSLDLEGVLGIVQRNLGLAVVQGNLVFLGSLDDLRNLVSRENLVDQKSLDGQENSSLVADDQKSLDLVFQRKFALVVQSSWNLVANVQVNLAIAIQVSWDPVDLGNLLLVAIDQRS